MTEFLEVRSERTDSVARMADIIWREHYAGILSDGQIDYMLETLQSNEAVARQIESEGYRYFVVRDNGTPMGYFAVREEPGERLFLSKLYVMDWARKRGVGRACLEYVDDLARRKGYKKLYLTVNKNNDAVAVYQKLGFAVTDSVVTDIGGGYVMDDYIMEREVS